MSTAETLSLVSLISYIVAGACFVLAIFFWFAFKIPSVIGDLSGRTAQKFIARMRASNEKAGGQGYKPSATNAGRSKLTNEMQHSKKLANEAPKAKAKEKEANNAGMPETGLLSSNKAELAGTDKTNLLVGSEATGLLVDEDATAPLHNEPVKRAKRVGGKKLTMLDEVILIHTDEVI